MNSLERQNIRSLAQYLYRLEGSPLGKAKEHWLSAERQLSENLFRDTPKGCGKSDTQSLGRR